MTLPHFSDDEVKMTHRAPFQHPRLGVATSLGGIAPIWNGTHKNKSKRI